MATSKLTREQLNYAQQRLTHVRQLEHDKIIKSTMIKYPTKTVGALMDAFKAGKIAPRKLTEAQAADPVRSSYLQVRDLFDVSKYETTVEAHVDRASRHRLLEAHDAKWNDVIDKLMLGDSEVALRLVKQYCSK